MVFRWQSSQEATRCLHAWQARLAPCAVPLPPTTPPLSECGRCARAKRQRRGAGKPETCTVLGCRPIGERTRNGKDTLRRKTEKQRRRAQLKAIQDTLRWHWHKPSAAQGAGRRSGVRGYEGSYAVPTHGRLMAACRQAVQGYGRRTLRRRSQRHRLPWERLERCADRWLPKPRILHLWPDARFAVKPPR